MEITEIIKAADETFEDTEEGNKKFREFVQKVIENEAKKNKFPDMIMPPKNPVGLKYGVPY